MTDTIEAGVPRLRVFRTLDETKLSEPFVDTVSRQEGTLPYVDADLARDVELTEEIMEATVGAILVDSQGDTVASFDGPDGWAQAERAKRSARITFSMDVPDAKPKRGSRAAVQAAVAVADPEDAVDEDPGFTD